MSGYLPWLIVALLFMILWHVTNIDTRLKSRFPTEKEQDRAWAKDDPLAHWDAHKHDQKRVK
jgi:hypothetical protein